MKNSLLLISLFALGSLSLLVGCGDNDDPLPALQIPPEYTSTSFESNVTAEATVTSELSTLTSAVNEAEANAQSTTVDPISFPSTLASVTNPTYKAYVDEWLVELVKAANSPAGFQNPGSGTPAIDEDGGLLGSRLLDENGLELEQMIEKGLFSAALYNHAVNVIEGDLTSASIDQLVQVFGTDPSFDPNDVSHAATYAKRRSFNGTQTGLFYDMKLNLITAKAAIEAGDAYNSARDEALAEFKLNWEKAMFSTVIYYCNATKTGLQSAGDDDAALGTAMHAYAEGVAFAAGFRGIADKQITDAQIDEILSLLLAPAGETPESYKFLNDATLLGNFDQVIDKVQDIYGFTDQEVTDFYVNDPS